jgi:hypothetical protein
LADVNGIIQEMLTLLKGEATRYSVAMRTELTTDPPKIMADSVQLQQVFMNLMLNAIEAMKDSGGELTVKSELQDGQLRFSVSDTGVGYQWRRGVRSFLRSLPPSRRAAAWGWPSAVPLWSRMAGSCGQASTVEVGNLLFHPTDSGHGVLDLGCLRHFCEFKQAVFSRAHASSYGLPAPLVCLKLQRTGTSSGTDISLA